MSTVFDVIHTAADADRYPADARFDDASIAPTTEELAQDRRDQPHSEKRAAEEEKAAQEKELEKALKDSFPASDPVSVANGTVAGAPDPITGKPARKAGRTNDKPPVD
jgi:hypothetical protein